MASAQGCSDTQYLSFRMLKSPKERKILGKQLHCLNDAIQRIASDTLWRQPRVVHSLYLPVKLETLPYSHLLLQLQAFYVRQLKFL